LSFSSSDVELPGDVELQKISNGQIYHGVFIANITKIMALAVHDEFLFNIGSMLP